MGTAGDDGKPPAWRAQEFAAAPTEEQLRALRVDEQEQRELKAQSGHQRATLGEAVSTIKAEDFLSVHKAPCSRQGILTGIGGGAALGALRFILGGEGVGGGS